LFEARPATDNGQPLFPLGGHTGPPTPVTFTELGAAIVIPAGAANERSPDEEIGATIEAQIRIAMQSEDLPLNEPKTLQIDKLNWIQFIKTALEFEIYYEFLSSFMMPATESCI
jgi:hypothetical protein